MAYEVDFLPVGDGERSGDAIALRFGKLTGPAKDQRVVVIDGGYSETGDELVEHIRKRYGTETVDLVISTHTDADHISGLFSVIENLKVGALWMHMPWKHSGDFAKAYSEGRVSSLTAKEKLRRSLDDAVSLEKLARKKGIPITEPFTGTAFADNSIVIVGPTEEHYAELLPDYRCFEPTGPSAISKALAGIREAVSRVAETWDIETLSDDGETSAENNSSAITLFQADGNALLFTADAGIPALSAALDALDEADFDYASLKFVQVPHHGSQRNIGPTVLSRLFGKPRRISSPTCRAYVSAAKDGAPKHPAKKVTNAFLRRGVPVHATQGQQKCHHVKGPERGWSKSEPLPLYAEVEE